MEEKQLTPAPIDDKNVLTDFTGVFHNGECISRMGRRKQYIEYFVVEDCLCAVEYFYRQNRFNVFVVTFNNQEDYEKAQKYLDKCIEQLRHDNVTEELVVTKEGTCTYAFYHVEK